MGQSQQQLFDRFKDGDEDALVELIELERPALFDYLFRMSAQRDSCLKVLDELVAVMRNQNLEYASLRDIKTRLFATARSFSAQVWNADTSNLQNDALTELDASDLPSGVTKDKLELIDGALRKLAGWEREPLILHYIHGFSAAEIASVTGVDERNAASSVQTSFLRLVTISGSSPNELLQRLPHLPKHMLLVSSLDNTAALSKIMSEVKRTRGEGKITSNRIFWVLVGVLILAALIVLFSK